MKVQPATDQLCEVNRRLRSLLGTFPRGVIDITSQQLATLLNDLSEIEAAFENGSIRIDQEIEMPVLREYRRLLEDLRRQIPVLHAHFLAERARLERERGYLRATAYCAHADLHTTHLK